MTRSVTCGGGWCAQPPDSRDAPCTTAWCSIACARLLLQVLKHHPDKQPADQDEKEQSEHTAAFTRAMASFEAIDGFYQVWTPSGGVDSW